MRAAVVRLAQTHPIVRPIVASIASVIDPKLPGELRGERYFFTRLKARGFLDGLKGKRILEIGPKHGEDSKLLASLEPRELVLVDMPSKWETAQSWLPAVERLAPTRYINGNIIYLEPKRVAELGRFDLVWCTGVLYHNAEQLRLCKRLFDHTAEGGRLVLETQLPTHRQHRRRNVIEVHWPMPLAGVNTVIFLPSTQATIGLLEMAGFCDVHEAPIISRTRKRSRVVVTGRRTADSRTYHNFNSETPLVASGTQP